MLHNNSVAFLKPCFQCLSTFNLPSFIKSIVMHSLQPPHRHQTASTSYLETLKCISWGCTLGRSMLKCSTNSAGGERAYNHLKDHCISTVNHINHFGTVKKLQNQNTHMPLIFCASGRTLLLTIRDRFSPDGRAEPARLIRPKSLPIWQNVLWWWLSSTPALVGQLWQTATRSYRGLEVWPVQQRN